MSIIQSIGGGLGGAGAPGGPLGSFYSYTLDQSLRFNDGDSEKLTRTPSSAGNRATWTWSAWVKKSGVGTNQQLFCSTAGDYNLRFHTDDTIIFEGAFGTNTSAAVFRDVSAFYHIVAVHDTTESTSSDRFKLYVNGVQQTTSGAFPSGDGIINNTVEHGIGGQASANFFDGYMAEINFIDGTALNPTSFGETKDGVWVPKEYSGSYGTNGFYLPFSHDTVSEGFTTVLYEGTRAVQSISGVGFKPDMVFVKRRDGVQEPRITDSVRGVNAQLRPAASNAESSTTNALTSFDADGFTLGADGTNSFNYYQDSHVAWCWEAGGAPTVDNSASAGATPTAGSVKIDGSNLGSALAGSIAATRLSANTTKGFSIVTYTGNGTAGATVAHGLSSAPEMIMVKSRSQSTSWTVYHSGTASDAETDYLVLDTANAAADLNTAWNDTAPTSSVFSLGTFARVNASTETFVAYSWHSVSGYSKFGSYTGSGSSGKAITGLGFRPVFVMIKRTDSSGGWHVFDSVRFPNNPIDERLEWDNAEAENTGGSNTLDIDFDSDGFTLQTSFDNMNASSGNYVYMAFADTRDSVFHKDTSGNLNNFEINNLDVNDVVPDSPTNNFATFNELEKHSGTALSQGNLVSTSGNANDWECVGSTIHVSSGKWYCEIELTAASGTLDLIIGVARSQSFEFLAGDTFYTPASNYGYYASVGDVYAGGSVDGDFDTTYAVGDIIGIAIDMDNLAVYFSKNGTFINSGDPTSGASKTGLSGALLSGASYQVAVGAYQNNTKFTANFGQDGTFAGGVTAGGNSDANGVGDFKYSVPSGYLALCTSNLPDITIGPGQSSQATDHFDTKLWSSDVVNPAAGDKQISLDFQPDWVWSKDRAAGESHYLVDSVRGDDNGSKLLMSDRTNAEGADAIGNSTAKYDFTTSGFDIIDTNSGSGEVYYNAGSASSPRSYVGWCWKAGGSASSNTDGSITSSVSANTAAGFSIVSYTGNATDGATVGHGLSETVEAVIVKRRDGTAHWQYLDKNLSSGKVLLLSSTGAEAAYSTFSAGGIDNLGSTTFSLEDGSSNGNNVNASGGTYIAYCFHSVEGYSKVGTYNSNGNANGTFVYTGFRPAWILFKNSTATEAWSIFDSVRDSFNDDASQMLLASSNATEASGSNDVDFLSNGFKVRTTNNPNTSGNTYIYLAFAEAPFKFANAR